VLFKGEWVQGTHEKLARAYKDKLAGAA